MLERGTGYESVNQHIFMKCLPSVQHVLGARDKAEDKTDMVCPWRGG